MSQLSYTISYLINFIISDALITYCTLIAHNNNIQSNSCIPVSNFNGCTDHILCFYEIQNNYLTQLKYTLYIITFAEWVYTVYSLLQLPPVLPFLQYTHTHTHI